MTLQKLLEMTTSITPLRIYKTGHPYQPLIDLIYSDSKQAIKEEYLTSQVLRLKVGTYYGIAYLVITIA